MVFMSHFALNTTPFDYGGDCGVAFFFMLSGFVLSHAHGGQVADGSYAAGRFFKKRLFKFYPLHLPCLLFTIAIHAGRLTSADYVRLLPNFFLIQSWFPQSDIYFSGNGVSWFLSDLLFMYLLFPCLYKRIHRARLRNLALAAIALTGAYVAFILLIPEDNVRWFVYVLPVSRLADFSIGIITCRICQETTLPSRFSSLSYIGKTAIELSLIAVLACWCAAYPSINPRVRTSLIFWTCLPPTIAFFAATDRNGGLITSILHKKFLLWLGRISFEIYMVHQIVINVILSESMKHQCSGHYGALLLLCILVTIASAQVSRKAISLLHAGRKDWGMRQKERTSAE